MQGSCPPWKLPTGSTQHLTWQDPDMIPTSPPLASPSPAIRACLHPARPLMAHLHGQHRFINLIPLAFSSHGVEAAAEPSYITYTNRSKPEAREVAGTVQHAHRVVMQRALSWRTAGARGHGGRSGLQPRKCEVYQISVNLWNKESCPGAGSLIKSCRHHWHQCRAGWFRR